MITDFRAELQALLTAIENDVIDTNDGPRFQEAVDRARAALVEPEPLSLKELALEALNQADKGLTESEWQQRSDTIRQALEQLDD